MPATTRCRTPLKSATRQPGPSAVLANSPSPAASLARDGATYTCRTWPGGGGGQGGQGAGSHLVRVPDQRGPGDAEGARGLVAEHRGPGGGAGHQLRHAPRPAQPRHPHLPPPRQPALHPLAGQRSDQVRVEEDDLPVVAVLAVLAQHQLAHQVGAAPDITALHRCRQLLHTWSWSTRSPPSRPACTAPG